MSMVQDVPFIHQELELIARTATQPQLTATQALPALLESAPPARAELADIAEIPLEVQSVVQLVQELLIISTGAAGVAVALGDSGSMHAATKTFAECVRLHCSEAERLAGRRNTAHQSLCENCAAPLALDNFVPLSPALPRWANDHPVTRKGGACRGPRRIPPLRSWITGGFGPLRLPKVSSHAAS